MSQPAIRIQSLGKRFLLGETVDWNRDFRETLATLPRLFGHKLRRLLGGKEASNASPYAPPVNSREFWALRDITFDVAAGEAVGIIGRNGAGKSTLLKVLSRITWPTEGKADIRGRVSSLLEVGTGFHQELTGRENIFLNGAILGMRHAEINRKFDAIVDFAGTERFLDTPVKRYSSGMRIRLGFAVAAHLDPDILIVDEVLAVGDIAFQNKCLRRMESETHKGKTVLLVSHNMQSVARLCRRGILLDDGRVIRDGDIEDVVQHYVSLGSGVQGIREWPDPESAPGNDKCRLLRVRVKTEAGKTCETFDIRRPVHLEFTYEVRKKGARLHPSFFLINQSGQIVFISGAMHAPEWANRPRDPGVYRSSAVLPGNLLAEGTYTIQAVLHTLTAGKPSEVHANEQDVVAFTVYDRVEGDSARGEHLGAYPGVVRPIVQWETEKGEFKPTPPTSDDKDDT
jgi:homopolymeric O-antigen transport system ATP-binding protein